MKRNAACLLSVLALACGEDAPEPARPYVVRFEASSGHVDPGERFLLEWEVTGADSVTITTLDGDLVVGGSEDAEGRAMAGPLLADTTFTLRAEGPGGRTGASVVVALYSGTPGARGAAIRLSPEAADRLGLLDAPVEVRITALRREAEILAK